MRAAVWRGACALALAVLLARPSQAQSKRALPGMVSLEVRSTDSVLRVLHVEITSRGGTLDALAVIGGAPGVVQQDRNGGHGTTPLMVRVSEKRGFVLLQVPGNGPRMRVVATSDSTKDRFELQAHAIEAVRDSNGLLTITPYTARPRR